MDPRETKIAILDKYSTELGVAAKRPTIILDRGPISWTGRYRAEAFPNTDGSNTSMYPRLTGDRSQNHKITQTWQGSLTLRVMAKRPYVADEIANDLFYQISGFREWFKEKGIHKFQGLSMGNERIVKLSSADMEVASVDINIAIERQETLRMGERQFNCRVYKGDTELFENIDFIVSVDGTQIELLEDPGEELDNLTIDYVDAITLEENVNKNLIPVSGNNRLYTVPDSGRIYGYYKLLSSVIINKDSTE